LAIDRPTMPDLTIDGLRLHWEEFDPEEASGRPVVLLHGLGSSGEDWLLQVPVLGRGRRILAPDLPGHGRSEGFRGWPRLEAYAGVVRRLIDQADAAPAHLVGLSLGGAVALQLAVDSPKHVSSLVMADSFDGFRPDLRVLVRSAAWLAHVLFGTMEGVAEWVAQDLFPLPEQADLRKEAAARLARNSRSDYLRALVAAARFDVRRRLGSVMCPALIVAGELDSLFPLKQQQEIAARIPGARLVIVPGSRHATPIDASEAFNRLVTEFLDEVEGRIGVGELSTTGP